MRKQIKCKCGIEVFANTLKSHIKGKHCGLDKSEKDKMITLLDLKTKNQDAWLIDKGLEATKNKDWIWLVIDGVTPLEAWTFIAPRPKGTLTPSTLQKFKETRRGNNNPLVKANNPNYNLDEVKIYAKECAKTIISNKAPFRDIIKQVNIKFPGVQYMLADIPYPSGGRGFNKDNKNLAFLLDISVEQVIKFNIAGRGYAISQGQKNSTKFKEMASRHGVNMSSSWRISKPHKILFNMIKSVDPDATMEKKVQFNNQWKSYDIWSPTLNAVIEMHGHMFHDIKKTKEGLYKQCEINMKNDDLKKGIATINGWKYIVFWDDNVFNWNKQIVDLYGKESISYENAKNQVDETIRQNACI